MSAHELLPLYDPSMDVLGKFLYMYIVGSTVRLVQNGVSGGSEGRLEVIHDGTWGTVCDDHFSDTEAKVACSALGFGYVVLPSCLLFKNELAKRTCKNLGMIRLQTYKTFLKSAILKKYHKKSLPNN